MKQRRGSHLNLKVSYETNVKLKLRWNIGFEENITRQRADSERALEDVENAQNEKLREINVELEQTLSKIAQLSDELDHKQLQESVWFWAISWFCSKVLKVTPTKGHSTQRGLRWTHWSEYYFNTWFKFNLITFKDILDDLSDVIDSPDNPDFLYQNDSLQHERSRLRTVFVDVKRQLTLESRKLDEYEQINKSS